MKNSSGDCYCEFHKNNEIFSDAIHISWDLLRRNNFCFDTSDERVSRSSTYLGVAIFEAIKKIRENFMNDSMCVDDQKVLVTLEEQQKTTVIKTSGSELDIIESNDDNISNDFAYSIDEDEDEEVFKQSEIDSEELKNDNFDSEIINHVENHNNDNKKINNNYNNNKNYSNMCTSSRINLSDKNTSSTDGVRINVIDDESDDCDESTSSSRQVYSVKASTVQQPSFHLPESRSTGAIKKYRPEDNTLDNNNGSRQYQLRSDSRENLETTTRSQSMSVPPQHLVEPENEWNSETYQENEVYNDDISTEELYKKIRGILNKLTPHNIDKMVDQIVDLDIDSQERLQGIVNLVFKKAIDDSNYAFAYAIMCRQLVNMQYDLDVSEDDGTEQGKYHQINFLSLLIARCQHELENNILDRVSFDAQLDEIKESHELEVEIKKELINSLTDNDRDSRQKSIGNIKFIGELFNQELLENGLISTYIENLLTTPDDVRLEYLCTLLTTIGKKLETSGNHLSDYFSTIAELTKLSNISRRIKFMLLDIIDLKARNWQPRNKSPINNQSKNKKKSNKKRSRDSRRYVTNYSRSSSVKSNRQPYSGETLKHNAPVLPLDEVKLGGGNLFQWGPSAVENNGSMQNKYALLQSIETGHQQSVQSLASTCTSTPKSSLSKTRVRSQSMPMTPSSRKNHKKYSKPPVPLANNTKLNKPKTKHQQLDDEFNILFNVCKSVSDAQSFVDIAMYQLQDKLDNSTYPYFIRKSFEIILVGPSSAREKYCILFAQMIINNIFPLSVFQSEYDKMFEEIESLDIYLAPTFWTSRAELLKPLVICDAHPMKELIRTTSVLKNMGFVGKLVGELLRLLVESEGPSTITEKWNASGIEWTDLLDTSLEDPDDIIEKYNLQFLTFGVTDPPNEKLLDLLRESDIANAIQWITENVDEEKSRKPKFIRTLFTGILESAIEPVEDSRYFCGAMAPYHFDRIKIMHLLSIMRHYIDSNLKSELQCLYAMSDVMHKYGNLSSFGGFLIHQLHEEKIISDNGFLAWHSCTNKSESIGHVEAVNCLINQPFWIELQRSFNNSEDEAWNDFISKKKPPTNK
ncbi:eukaryotic translation initiation factor 4 gamma 3-like [Aphidius gifuensis]|uniref:eukaryotic translation initiation factor 4 gamma 3-like n=1 Tax=Aphidius gifuensis TaxID=684658 RepID=UPI001CDBD176|nr:eukaryotic translation initiation factor 4 gamma 3-like [Aphidius gifuensis]